MVITGEKSLSRKGKSVPEEPEQKPIAAERDLARYRRILDTTVLLAGSEFIKPLSSIKGYIGLIREGREERKKDSARDDHYFERAEEAIYDLEQLIHLYMQLLRYSEGCPEAGDIRRIRIRDFMGEVIAKYCGQAGTIENRVEETLPEISVQRNPLRVAAGNVLSNIVKSGNGSCSAEVHSRVWTEDKETGEGFLIIDIMCAGNGISGSLTEKGSKRSGKRDEPGMLLAKNIIEIMGGSLEANSVQGAGRTTTISFPAIVDGCG